MTAVTIVIPVANYHADLAQRAISSAQQQTVACTIITALDKQGRGPSYTRNRALEQVKTEFVVFLDADDWLEPEFVEACLDVYQPGHYVYTDWYEDDTVKQAPDCAWGSDGGWHVITSLLPMAYVKAVGGFDDLPGAEDTEFYWGLTRRLKCCGIRVPRALFHYGSEGQRAKQFIYADPVRRIESDAYRKTMAEIRRRYNFMGGCCGGKQVEPSPPEGEPGDVLAQAIWAGNQQRRGPKTGRLYPRSGNGKVMKVDPADAAARPDWWRVIESGETQVRPAENGAIRQPEVLQAQSFDELARLLGKHALGIQRRTYSLNELQSVPAATVQPDVARLVELARAAYE